jgi:hypothetical protein
MVREARQQDVVGIVSMVWLYHSEVMPPIVLTIEEARMYARIMNLLGRGTPRITTKINTKKK